ncbi:MAG: thiamine pyrophosphate-dependent dehydrogenase E1 component subunit alpha [Alphaproteobacteria bacterium]|nr:thiamine pyrophosphate-dependent dehydrogenase E1 component subunit alpha [Alphaproteobacteria bacterium]
MPSPAKLTSEDIRRIYRSLRLIRRAEEEIARVYPSDRIKSPVHLSIGQEAVAVGVCDALTGDDVVSGTYRGHATYLAKGGDLNAMMAELFGKVTGCARGKGGSMHLVEMSKNVLGASAVVGTTIPLAVGYALALRREGRGRVAAAFFGDGATEEGVFYESLNFASLHKLPVVFVCENNFYAIHTPLTKRWASEALCGRVANFGIPTHRITDSDVFAIRRIVADAVAEMRQGAGPIFLECHTYRWREHVGPMEDYEAGYRDRNDMETWRATDQLERVGALLDATTRGKINIEIEKEIAAAIEFADQSPFPPPEELHTHVFAGQS